MVENKYVKAGNVGAIIKKKYRDKVRSRLEIVQSLFADRELLVRTMRRVAKFDKGSDFHNKMEAIDMLLNTDVPALLDALDTLGKLTQSEKHE